MDSIPFDFSAERHDPKITNLPNYVIDVSFQS